ncbi:trans-acting enoyl reductase [Scenedesmus sp. PABB004]|nr:trans-acting enoyl reductase [Scenedesmus sp. PABB004]
MAAPGEPSPSQGSLLRPAPVPERSEAQRPRSSSSSSSTRSSGGDALARARRCAAAVALALLRHGATGLRLYVRGLLAAGAWLRAWLARHAGGLPLAAGAALAAAALAAWRAASRLLAQLVSVQVRLSTNDDVDDPGARLSARLVSCVSLLFGAVRLRSHSCLQVALPSRQPAMAPEFSLSSPRSPCWGAAHALPAGSPTRRAAAHAASGGADAEVHVLCSGELKAAIMAFLAHHSSGHEFVLLRSTASFPGGLAAAGATPAHGVGGRRSPRARAVVSPGTCGRVRQSRQLFQALAASSSVDAGRGTGSPRLTQSLAVLPGRGGVGGGVGSGDSGGGGSGGESGQEDGAGTQEEPSAERPGSRLRSPAAGQRSSWPAPRAGGEPGPAWGRGGACGLAAPADGVVAVSIDEPLDGAGSSPAKQQQQHQHHHQQQQQQQHQHQPPPGRGFVPPTAGLTRGSAAGIAGLLGDPHLTPLMSFNAAGSRPAPCDGGSASAGGAQPPSRQLLQPVRQQQPSSAAHAPAPLPQQPAPAPGPRRVGGDAGYVPPRSVSPIGRPARHYTRGGSTTNSKRLPPAPFSVAGSQANVDHSSGSSGVAGVRRLTARASSTCSPGAAEAGAAGAAAAAPLAAMAAPDDGADCCAALAPFHLALPVRDVAEARDFYTRVVGCSEGRSSARWQDFNFFGHQLVAHQVDGYAAAASENSVDGDPVPVPHFGLTLSVQQFHALAARLTAAGRVEFVLPPHLRFRGQPGEQWTMFFKDPSGNSLEFKAMVHPGNLFARYVVDDDAGGGGGVGGGGGGAGGGGGGAGGGGAGGCGGAASRSATADGPARARRTLERSEPHKMAATGAARPYQITVWGASGFTGRLVCEHLATSYKGAGIRWAMAGRSRERLDAVKAELVKIDPALESVPYVIADADDEAALGRMAADTQVLIATAGPFAKYGSKVVAAAVEHGADYVDITGELLWVKRMIAAHDAAAAAKGVRIVHCCGYDSIPFDLGVAFLSHHARTQLGRGLSQAYGLSVDARGGFSGGTIASGFHQAEAEEGAEVAAMMRDKYYLLPSGAPRGSDSPPGLLPEWNAVAKKWMAPFVMEPINARIVQRSSWLAGGYGEDFKYREAMALPAGAGGLLGAAGVSAAMVGVGAMFALAPLRNLAKRKLPQPGEGPSRSTMLGGYWKHDMVGLTEEAPGVAPQVIVARVADPARDPGYWGTARMLLEAGLCLALDSAACAEAGCKPGGVLTPASAMGLVLVNRLRAAGLQFAITSSPALPAGGGAAATEPAAVGAAAGKQ